MDLSRVHIGCIRVGDRHPEAQLSLDGQFVGGRELEVGMPEVIVMSSALLLKYPICVASVNVCVNAGGRPQQPQGSRKNLMIPIWTQNFCSDPIVAVPISPIQGRLYVERRRFRYSQLLFRTVEHYTDSQSTAGPGWCQACSLIGGGISISGLLIMLPRAAPTTPD